MGAEHSDHLRAASVHERRQVEDAYGTLRSFVAAVRTAEPVGIDEVACVTTERLTAVDRAVGVIGRALDL